MSIQENIRKLRAEIPGHVAIIAVSKRKPVEDIMQVYEAGHRIFGENRVQELIEKQALLPGDIDWHMIGHLQTNKVKYIAGFVDMIHSVDSLKLALAIDREADKTGRVIPVLLQVYIADEESKFGFSEDELNSLLDSQEISVLRNIRIDGLMGMATYTEDLEKIRSEFRYLGEVFSRVKNAYFAGSDHFRQISMGMSGDYEIAIEEGSTMIRVGTVIFGARTY
ncbi:MAG: YggS family pyridoxal phosphate-dependent enzyme [Bacteroidales bacterium]